MSNQPAVTEEAFLANRVEFFHGFIKFATYTTVAVIAIVALMGIFLG
jgi:hypothetical protein